MGGGFPEPPRRPASGFDDRLLAPTRKLLADSAAKLFATAGRRWHRRLASTHFSRGCAAPEARSGGLDPCCAGSSPVPPSLSRAPPSPKAIAGPISSGGSAARTA